MSSNTTNNNNNNSSINTSHHRANTSARRAHDIYFHVSQLPTPPRWAGITTTSPSQQHTLFAHNQQCGNVTSRRHPRTQYLEYMAEAYDPADARGERRIRTPLCRECAFAIDPDFVRGVEEARRRGAGRGDEDALDYALRWLERS